MTGVFWLVLAAAGLVVVASLLASAEAALARISRSRVDELTREQRRGAGGLATFAKDPSRHLNLLMLLRLVSEVAATVLVTIALLHQFEPRGSAAVDDGALWMPVAIAVAVMTIVNYVVVGVAPRTLGIQHAERVALFAAGWAVRLGRIFGPLPRLLIALGNALTPGKGFREGPFATQAELRDLVDLAEEHQLIESGERQMIHSVFELGDTIVREVMVPRTDMVFIERTKTVRQALSLALRSGYSRIPVIGENSDDVVGVVYLKDIARRYFDNREDTERVETVMRQPTYVPDSKPVDELLREMQAAQIHLAIVIDEYGGTAGLVTIEDILEEIVGEIVDEYDREQPRVEHLEDGTVRVSVRVPIDDLEELFGVELPHEGVETVGGLFASALGRVPIPGTTVEVNGLRLLAESTAGRRHTVDTVVVSVVTPDVADQASDDAAAVALGHLEKETQS